MNGNICINRNIVECKMNSNTRDIIDSQSINRNIVECKMTFSMCHAAFNASINRNIVECKNALIVMGRKDFLY